MLLTLAADVVGQRWHRTQDGCWARTVCFVWRWEQGVMSMCVCGHVFVIQIVATSAQEGAPSLGCLTTVLNTVDVSRVRGYSARIPKLLLCVFFLGDRSSITTLVQL